jgi:hypothetical protein
MSETTSTPKLYGSIAEIRAANKAAGQHWFDRDTLRFFDGVVPEDQPIVHGRFFVSSEQFDHKSLRLHTLRHARPTGVIDTVGDHGQFDSFDDARAALSDAIAAGVSVRQVSGEPDADPAHFHWQVFVGELPIDHPRARADAETAGKELTAVLASEAPPSKAGDYELDESEPNSRVCERDVLGTMLRFEWSGGIYIDVSCPPGSAQEVINIGADTGGARIDYTQQADFEREVDEWIERYPPQDLLREVAENWDNRPR